MNTTKQVDLNVCLNIKTQITNDSTDLVKEIDVKVKVIQWIVQELNIPMGCDLDISNGYGEVEILGLEEIHAEVM